MKDSIRHKLDAVRERHEELEGLLAEPEIINDQNQYRELSQEYSRIGPIVKLFADFLTLQTDIVAAEEMIADSDPEIREMGQGPRRQPSADELSRLSKGDAPAVSDLQKKKNRGEGR